MKPENKKELVDILTYHVLPEAVLSTDLKASQAVKTVEGKTLDVTKSGGLVRVGPSSKDLKNVIKADNLASNGVVHIIDGVLLPPSSMKNTVQLADAAGVGLPACPKAIFHGFCHPWELRDGGVACVRDVSSAAKIMKPSDVQCVPKKNGGSRYRCPSWVPQMCQPVYDGKNIVQLAESVSELSTLVAAVVAGDLADTLSSPGPFTVFAPTNKGFAALPAGTLTKLMKPENKKELVDILTYHVLPEKVLSTDLKLSQAVKTVEGKLLQVTRHGRHVQVGASSNSKDLKNVIKADNLASNGVVHIIDGVLIPPATPNIVKLAESVKDLSTLVAAVVAGGLADTL